MTRELIAGITRFSSLGFMLLGAVRPGVAGRDYAAWRLLPHLYAPKSWNLPLDLGLVAGFSFQRTTYEENSRRVEIRPISEKKFGHFQLDANPFFGRALYGPGVREGWNFEPAGRCQACSRARAGPPDLPRRRHPPGRPPALQRRRRYRHYVRRSAPVYKSRFEFSFGGKSGGSGGQPD